MAATIADVMRHCNNYFVFAYTDNVFAVTNGAIAYSSAPDGCYVAVTGSAYNNGLYTVMGGSIATGGADEEFEGRVWVLHPPKDFLALCDEIAAYEEKHGTSDIVSESFGNYSMTRGSVNGVPIGWQGAFAARLMPYRRMYSEVSI